MAEVASLYNQLPTLEDAERRFRDRDQVFSAAKSLLAQYGKLWGLCLIHAHCKLEKGEIMVARGNVSQPEPEDEVPEYYPERWLPSGEAYEFTTRRTITPPTELIHSMHDITSQVGVLGLYYIGEDHEQPGKVIERTEGRKNILSPYTDEDEAHTESQTETAWDLSSFNPVTMACNKIIICDSRTTRAGAVHKSK